MENTQTLILALALLAVTSLAACCVLYLRLQASKRVRNMLAKERDMAMQSLQVLLEKKETRPFDEDLEKAEIRNQLNMPENSGDTIPEKYQYVASLAQHGMGAEEIAETLDISQAEAEQLIELAKAARHGVEDPKE